MGICYSSSVATAKLILQDGELIEFLNPVRVSQILQENPSCFVCNSDDMDFNKVLSAMNEAEELQQGELYFVLPLSCLNSLLRAEEMASLAISASLAMKMNGGGREKYFCNCLPCGIKRINDHQMMFNTSCKREDESRELMASFGSDSPGGGGGVSDSCVSGCDIGFVPKRKQRRGVKKGRLTATLGVILEE